MNDTVSVAAMRRRMRNRRKKDLAGYGPSCMPKENVFVDIITDC